MIGQNRGRGTETETETLPAIGHKYGVEFSVYMEEASGKQTSRYICSLLREHEKRRCGYPGHETRCLYKGASFTIGMDAANSRKCTSRRWGMDFVFDQNLAGGYTSIYCENTIDLWKKRFILFVLFLLVFSA
jgi:hypothetical protein